MTFFIIFICLVAELAWVSFAPLRGVGWIGAWYAFLVNRLNLRQWAGSAGGLIAVALPACVIAYVFRVSLADSSAARLVFGTLVLLWCSGPRDIASEIAYYRRDYLDRDDDAPPLDRNNFLKQVEAPPGDPDRPYETAIAVAANDGLFAPMFWFALLGPPGAVIFRMSSVLVRDESLDPGERGLVRRLYELLDWIPARLLALGLGLAGTLGPVTRLFASADHGLAQSDAFLGQAALAALGSHRDDAHADDDEHIGAIYAMYGLVKRGFLVWLVVLALLVAAGVV